MLGDLALDERTVAVLLGIDAAALERFAGSLLERRWQNVSRTVPATAAVWPELRDRCRLVSTAAEDDASGQGRRSPGLRALLQIRAPIEAELRRNEVTPPWLRDLFAFEIEHALAREEGLARELECDWPAHQIAERCVRGELAGEVARGSFRYRLIADQVFVKGS